MNEIILAGCNPIPLASYLKALGILRLVAEQADPAVRGYWRAERFVLVSRLTQAELLEFFLQDYRPTPILAPWNGGSGFYAADNKDGFDPLAATAAARFQPLHDGIATAQRILGLLGLVEKPAADRKPRLLTALRAEGSEAFIAWLDAAVVLTAGDPSYPPLLGTGGNDGRLDFTNNFLQRLVQIIDPATGMALPGTDGWLRCALDGTPTAQLAPKKAIGQFAPGQAGGVNGTTGFSSDSLINPWDFVLMLEGALLFVTATTRRLESGRHAVLAYPFTVHANGAGCGAMVQGDAASGSSRGEMWLPLWLQPARLEELRTLLAEGRVTVNRRSARDGLDFARAVSQLGIDRGIAAFHRYSFMVRNGLAYLATPLDRIEARRAPTADLINDLEQHGFLDLLQREARSRDATASLKRGVARLENALFTLTRPGAGSTAVQHALVALGELLQILAASRKGQAAVATLPRLSPAWVLQAHDGSRAYRIAVALASLPEMVRYLAPVARQSGRGDWVWHPESRSRVWSGAELTANLNRIAIRRVLDFERAQATGSPLPTNEQAHPFRSGLPTLAAPVGDIAGFLSARADDRRIAALLQGLICAGCPTACPQPVPQQVRRGLTSRPSTRIRCRLRIASSSPCSRRRRHCAASSACRRTSPGVCRKACCPHWRVVSAAS